MEYSAQVNSDDAKNRMKEGLEGLISRYNELYGYLGANWERSIEDRYVDGGNIFFDVYFDDIDVYISIDSGDWTPDTYLDLVAEIAIEKSQELMQDGRIESCEPECFEMAF